MTAELDEAVRAEVDRLRIRELARRAYDDEKAVVALAIPPVVRLDDLLAQPDERVSYRIDRVWPVGGNIVLPAQHKAGKSTTVSNAVRSLVDGDDFLGAFRVQERARRVVLVDAELDPRTLRRWFRDQGILNADRVSVVSLRGRVSTFDLLDARTRALWAEAIGHADVLVIDCLRPILDALGLDENHDAGRFLVALDALKLAVGASELLLVHHMGHSAERARGDSRILDWPDATWKIVRQNDNPASPRFFSAFGRDVDVPEGRLTYDEVTRALAYGEGSRRDAQHASAIEDMAPAVLAFVAQHPGCSGTDIEKAKLGGAQAVRTARDNLADTGALVRTKRTGRGGGWVYEVRTPSTPATPSQPCQDGEQTPSTPVYETGLGFGEVQDEPRHQSDLAIDADEDTRCYDMEGTPMPCPPGMFL